MNQLNFTTILTLFILTTILGCEGTQGNCYQYYKFKIPMFISPAQDTFHKEDTIVLRSILNKEIPDLNSGELINIINHDFQIYGIITRMDLEGHPDAQYSFEINNLIGEHIIGTFGPYPTSKYSYDVGNSMQEFIIEWIPKEVGLYKFGFFALTEDLKGIDLTDSKCIENIDLIFEMNENTGNNNYHLLTDVKGEVVSEEGFKNDGCYVFEVIE